MSDSSLVGKRYGRLVVKNYAGMDIIKKVIWNCECDCGTVLPVRANSLVSGNTKSCGCYRRELRAAKQIHEGIILSGQPVPESWRQDVKAFIEDMGLPPGAGFIISKRNPDLPYSKSNCFWSDQLPELRSISCHTLIEHNGETKSVLEWSEKYDIKVSTLMVRLSRGYTNEAAFNNPLRTYTPPKTVTHKGIDLTLPKYANAIGINYRTLLSKLRRGITLDCIAAVESR